MAVIIGSATQIIIDGETDGFQSAQWAIQVQTNRLWHVGHWSSYATQVIKTLTVNVTTYAGALSEVTLTPSTDCTDSTARKNIYINPASCSIQVDIFDEPDMFITSYSYSKGDPNTFGTESWSFQKWVDSEVTGTDIINTIAPTAVIQGITEGNYTADAGLDIGLVLDTEQRVTGFQGDVSAGFPGIGQANITTYGIVTKIGGGDLENAGKIGNSSASIPHQPIYA